MSQILFFLLLVLLPTQLGYHVWPDWALVLGRRIDYLSPTLYATDIIIFFLVASWFCEKRKKIRVPFLKIVIFLGFIFVNIYFAANRMVAAFAWIKIVELMALGIYIVTTKPKLSSVIVPLSVGVVYSSVIAITQFLLQHSIGGIFWFLGERTFSSTTPGIAQIPLCFLNQSNCPLMVRAYGTFPHPNVLGGFLAITLPLIMSEVFKKKNKFFVSAVVLGIAALALTFSRSAWVVFVIGVLYVIFRKKKNIFFPILTIAVIFLFFVATTFGFQDESVVVREQLQTAALSMFRGSPIIGNGLGNFLVQLPDYLVSRQIYFLQPVHNIYLLILSEIGIAGLALFLWILWKAARHSKIILAIVLLGLIDHYFLTLQQGQLLLTIFLSLSLIQ